MVIARLVARSLLAILIAGCLPVGPRVPEVRPMDRILAHTAVPLRDIASIRPLRDGRVLVIDNRGQQLIVFDPALSLPIVVGDSSGASGHLLSRPAAKVIRAAGDSSLLYVQSVPWVRLLNGGGWVVDSFRIAGIGISQVSGGSLDPLGRFVFTQSAPPSPRDSGGQSRTLLLRGSLKATAFDTLGTLYADRFPALPPNNPPGQGAFAILLGGDAWGMLADGTVAIVRAHDYHIDWIDMNGARRSTPPMPNDWRILSTADKQFLIDSVGKTTVAVRLAVSPVGATPRALPPPPTFLSTVESLPDSVRPIGPTRYGTVLGDWDGHLWIHKASAFLHQPGAALGERYDVVDRRGRVIERVQLPARWQIAGFGPGVAYVAESSALGISGGINLYKMRIH